MYKEDVWKLNPQQRRQIHPPFTRGKLLEIISVKRYSVSDVNRSRYFTATVFTAVPFSLIRLTEFCGNCTAC